MRALTVRSRALGAFEPRQVRKEAALRSVPQVPRNRLTRARQRRRRPDDSLRRRVRATGLFVDRDPAVAGAGALDPTEPGDVRDDERHAGVGPLGEECTPGFEAGLGIRVGLGVPFRVFDVKGMVGGELKGLLGGQGTGNNNPLGGLTGLFGKKKPSTPPNQ